MKQSIIAYAILTTQKSDLHFLRELKLTMSLCLYLKCELPVLVLWASSIGQVEHSNWCWQYLMYSYAILRLNECSMLGFHMLKMPHFDKLVCNRVEIQTTKASTPLCHAVIMQHLSFLTPILNFEKLDTITKSIKSLGRLNLIHTTKLHWINFLFNVLQLNHDLLYMFFLYICVTNTRSMTVYHTFYITRRRQCMMFTDNSQLVQISFIKFDTAYMIYVWFMLFYLFKFSICLYGE